MNDERRIIGAKGEEAAAAFLQDKGYRIVDRNWRCRSGELDLVAKDADCWVFAEVRTRTSTGSYGTALESVVRRKQLKVRQVARMYLHARNIGEDVKVRFDVVGVLMTGGKIRQIRHIEGGF